MMTAHFAFCVCILLVLKPLQALRGNQEFHVEPAEFQAATLQPPPKAGFSAAKLKENGFKAKQVLKVEKNYQEAFDIVYGMQMDDALTLLKGSQNENLKGLVSDLQQLRTKKFRKVTAQAAGDCDPLHAGGDCNPLHEAARRGLPDLAEALIRKGADLEAKDGYGWTPLNYAAEEGHDKVAELLLQNGADVEAKDTDGRTSLHRAAEYGHDKVVELLLQKGANVEAKDEKGQTPLHRAARYGHDKVVELLLQKGADVQAKDADGWTPLHSAAASRRDKVVCDKVVELLLEKGANVEAKDIYGWTPLDVAIKGDDKVVELLKVAGARK